MIWTCCIRTDNARKHCYLHSTSTYFILFLKTCLVCHIFHQIYVHYKVGYIFSKVNCDTPTSKSRFRNQDRTEEWNGWTSAPFYETGKLLQSYLLTRHLNPRVRCSFLMTMVDLMHWLQLLLSGLLSKDRKRLWKTLHEDKMHYTNKPATIRLKLSTLSSLPAAAWAETLCHSTAEPITLKAENFPLPQWPPI